MNTLSADSYRRVLEPWCRFARSRLHRLPDGSACYGIGSHGHWAMQAHDTAFAALAVLAADPHTDPARMGCSRDELADTALAMLRFTLRSHKAGGGACADGQPWGHSWISALGQERLMHGVDALEPVLPPDLRALWRTVLTSEADWLLAGYPVKAGLVTDNKPESNLWNGAYLHRAAMLFPDAPNAAGWREKGTAFLVNSLSTPADVASDEQIAGRAVRDWHVGANFFPGYACNHHGYLNVGYMVICLSNLAMFHFTCRARGVPVPEGLERHARDLWALVSACTFPDGRLLRIGGDTRVRYAYCQDYAIPMWLYARDRLGDPAAEAFESGWLRQVEREREQNADGSFQGARLARLDETSPTYFLRLEGDKACSCSMGLYWRRTLGGFPAAPAAPVPAPAAWSDDHHGAFFHKSSRRFASWVWEAAEKPQGLCLPPDASDWAEWKTNLAGRIKGIGRVNTARIIRKSGAAFEGGFATCGRAVVQTQVFISEGDMDEDIAELDLACAALPDDATVVVLQRARAMHRVYLREIGSLMLQVLNDVQNGFRRRLYWNGGKRTFKALPGRDQVLDLGSRWINVEDRMGAVALYGSPSFLLARPADRQITIKDYPTRSHSSEGGGSVYAEEILLHARRGLHIAEGGEVLFDIGVALRCGEKRRGTGLRAAEAVTCVTHEEVRAVRVSDARGRGWWVAANFGDAPAALPPPCPATTLTPGEAAVLPA